jgi:hypothetical protein
MRLDDQPRRWQHCGDAWKGPALSIFGSDNIPQQSPSSWAMATRSCEYPFSGDRTDGASPLWHLVRTGPARVPLPLVSRRPDGGSASGNIDDSATEVLPSYTGETHEISIAVWAPAWPMSIYLDRIPAAALSSWELRPGFADIRRWISWLMN